MSVIIFRVKYSQLKTFSIKMKRELIPYPIQKAMIKHYAIDLQISLTEKMIDELLID
jgi:hypothetical protein